MPEAMRIAMVAVVAMVVGCGGSDEDIEGSWAADLNSSCAMVYTFDTRGGNYGATMLCQTGDNRYGAELEGGTANYSSPGRLSATRQRTSCTSSSLSPDSATYSFRGGQLALSVAWGTVYIMNKVPASGTSTAVVDLGCWNMGRFEPHPFQNL